MRFALWLFCFAAAAQPPAIFQESVVNAASRIPPSLPGGGLAPGSEFSIRGIRFGSSPKIVIANGSEALVVSSTPDHIDARLSPVAKLGETTLHVTTSEGSSAEFPIRIVPSSLGFYSDNGHGWGPAALTEKTGSLDSPAQTGDLVGIRATGTGADNTLDLWVGGVPAVIEGILHSGSRDVVLFKVPPKAPEACFVPVIARTPSGFVSNAVTIAIGETPCRENSFWPIRHNTPDLRTGLAMLFRERIYFHHAGKSFRYFKDEVLSVFFERKADRPVTVLQIFPPEGTCTAMTGVFAPDQLSASFNKVLFTDVVARALNPGPELTIEHSGNVKKVPPMPGYPGEYKAVLADPKDFKPFLISGEDYKVATPGGSGIVRLQPPVAWLNRARMRTADRSRPLLFDWKPAAADTRIAVIAVNIDQDTTAMSACICMSRAGQHRLAIPPQYLANLPPNKNVPGPPTSLVFLITMPGQPLEPAKAEGLDALYLYQAHLEGQTISFH